jgi:IclR family transcriptional regulator, KDG regulon repressor
MATRASSERYHLHSVTRAFDLLHCFSSDQTDWGVSELAGHLGIMKSAVHRILVTFLEHGFVKQNANRKYSLGPRLVYLHNLYRDRMDLLRCARPLLQDLAERTTKTCHLAKLFEDEIVYLLTVRPRGAYVFTVIPALHGPAYCTALGKVLLAHLPEEDQERILRKTRFEKRTRNTIVGMGRVRNHLRLVRSQGYATDDEEVKLTLRCIAAPIWNSARQVEAALSMSGHTADLTTDLMPDCIRRVCETAAAISAKMGFSP